MSVSVFRKIKLFNTNQTLDPSNHQFEIEQESNIANNTVNIRCVGAKLRFFTDSSSEPILTLDTANNSVTVKGDLIIS